MHSNDDEQLKKTIILKEEKDFVTKRLFLILSSCESEQLESVYQHFLE